MRQAGQTSTGGSGQQHGVSGVQVLYLPRCCHIACLSPVCMCVHVQCRGLHWHAGHGKGTWDGIGGLVKRQLRQDVLHKMFLASSNKLSLPYDCYEHTCARFCSAEWRQRHEKFAIKEVKVFWGGVDGSAAESADVPPHGLCVPSVTVNNTDMKRPDKRLVRSYDTIRGAPASTHGWHVHV